MPVINTNLQSMVAQNHLKLSFTKLNTAIEHMSSGSRVPNAKEDSAGQAIANRFTSNIVGLTQAARNANDGISIAQTTEGALNEINNNVQNIRRLTVQAANGSNSLSDLSSIQDEIRQRLAEIDRVSEQTEFNGVKVLSTVQTCPFQVGANDGQKILIGLREVSAKTLGLEGFNISGPKGTPSDASTAANNSAFIKAFGARTTVTTAAVAEKTPGDLAKRLGVAAGSVALTADKAFVDDNSNLFAKVTITAADADKVNKLNAQGFNVELTNAKEFYIALDPKSADITTAVDKAAFTLDTSALSMNQLTLTATINPLTTLSDALSKIDEQRGALGAFQNRFESTIKSLDKTIVDLTAARSRIEDADIAVEVSNMSRAQILQKTGNYALSQANDAQQLVLALLR